jgi:hypothetical protein
MPHHHHQQQQQEEQEHQQHQQKRHSGGKQRADHVSGRLPVMEDSGQTDAERRELRQNLRTLHKKMQDMAEELEDVSSSSFAKLRQDNNQLWNQVRYTREAVLDGDNLDVLANRAARQVDKLIEVRF